MAEQWLKTHNVEAVSRARFDEFLKQSPATAATVRTETDREALFRQFQAWEAVLQATDWGSWAGFMSTGMKIGTAPGYKVSNVLTRCGKGGMLGQQCTMQATLCK